MINSINVSEKTNEELIKDLEAKKTEAVASDDFEEAIKIRDEIIKLKSKELVVDANTRTDEVSKKTEEHIKEMDTAQTKTNEENKTKMNDLMGKLNDEPNKEIGLKGSVDIEQKLDETALNKIAFEKIAEAVRLLREANGLARLKKYDNEYFSSHYNGKVDDRGYLYDKEGKATAFLSSQIDTNSSKQLDGRYDHKNALKQLEQYLRKQLEQYFNEKKFN